MVIDVLSIKSWSRESQIGSLFSPLFPKLLEIPACERMWMLQTG